MFVKGSQWDPHGTTLLYFFADKWDRHRKVESSLSEHQTCSNLSHESITRICGPGVWTERVKGISNVTVSCVFNPLFAKVVAVLPGLTLTNMVPKSSFMKMLGENLFYSSEAACNAALQALFDPSLQGGEMVSNTWNFFVHTSMGRRAIRVLNCLKAQFFFTQYVMAPCMGLLQHVFYGYHVQKKECVLSEDNVLTEISNELFQWTLEELEPYKPHVFKLARSEIIK